MSKKHELAIPSDNYVITKSNILIEAKYKLNLTEQRLVLMLASFIHPDDEQFATYKVSIKAFHDWLGLKGKPKYKEIVEVAEGLLKRPFTIRTANKRTSLNWLSSATYYETEGILELCFDPKLRPYLLHLQKEYTHFSSKNINRLKSTYSIRIYELCRQYLKIGYRDITVIDLREMLGLEDEYPEYSNFKQKVLSKSQKELTEKTDIMFDFIETKRGRAVHSLKFVIKNNPSFVRPMPDLPTNENIPTALKGTMKTEQEIELLINEISIFCKEKKIRVYKNTIMRWLQYEKQDILIAVEEYIKQKPEKTRPAVFITDYLKDNASIKIIEAPKPAEPKKMPKSETDIQEIIELCASADVRTTKTTIKKWLRYGKENVINAINEVATNPSIKNPPGFISWRLDNPIDLLNLKEEYITNNIIQKETAATTEKLTEEVKQSIAELQAKLKRKYKPKYN